MTNYDRISSLIAIERRPYNELSENIMLDIERSYGFHNKDVKIMFTTNYTKVMTNEGGKRYISNDSSILRFYVCTKLKCTLGNLQFNKFYLFKIDEN